jgi:hypothetical protein
MEIEFCIRDKSITYTYKKVDPKVSLVLSGHKVSEPCGEVTFPLNMEKLNQHDVTLDVKVISSSLVRLFSDLQDETISKKKRHYDAGAQAFIAWQNARFS